MKYTVQYSKKFQKKIKKYNKSGNFNLEKVKKVIKLLKNGKKLDLKYKDHKLRGNMKDFRECHIEPDLLLVYQIIENELILVLIDLGKHSELFN